MTESPIVKQLSLIDPLEIPLSNGCIALADPIDSDILEYRWHGSRGGRGCDVYARRNITRGKQESMHRMIMARVLGRPLTSSEQVDHINMNTLDNRRSNLRLATNAENVRNRPKPSTNTSGYKGVHYKKQARKWQAYIKVYGKRLFLGSFDDPETAYKAYCEAAKKHFGEFARLE